MSIKTSAEIICDSVSSAGIRMTTLKLVFPRIILPEVNTHRQLSKNAASSRARPLAKQLEEVRNHPFVPKVFHKNIKGMQGGEPLDQIEYDQAVNIWLRARNAASILAEEFETLKVHKQISNRILEPFTWTEMVMSGTDFDNMLALRCHKDAQPEFKELADCIYDARENSTPRAINDGDWHLPFIQAGDVVASAGLPATERLQRLIVTSVARAARVSYKLHDGSKSNYCLDSELYNRLLTANPPHSSAFEHCAMAVGDPNVKSGNLRGFIQYRQTIKGHDTKHFKKS